MLDLFLLLKCVHVLGAIVLLGTGLGIAFFMFMADRSCDVVLIAGVLRIVVIADFLFTATSLILQPITGVGLAALANYDLAEGWIGISLLLYVVAALCWLPAVWMQLEMRRLAQTAACEKTDLPARYHVLMQRWFWSGWPAFVAVLGILYLMVAKPQLW